MRFYLNLTDGAVSKGLFDRSHQADGWVTKRGGWEIIEVQTHRDSVPELLPPGTPILFGDKLQFDGAYLMSAATFAAPGGASGFYTAVLATNTTPINTALGSPDGNVANDVPTIGPTFCEIQYWLHGPANPPTKSQTFSVRIDNTVNNGNETDPETSSPYPAPAAIARVDDLRFPSITIPGTLDPTGTADSSSAILNAIETLRPLGDALRLPAGAYRVDDSLVFDTPVKLSGDGCGWCANTSGPGAAIGAGYGRGGTTIYTNRTTGDALVFNANGSTVRDIAVVNTAAGVPTAGAGLKFAFAHQANVTRVIVANFWDNVHFVSGFLWKMLHCGIYDAVNTGCLIEDQAIHDGGDTAITECEFVTFLRPDFGTSADAIRHLSGGGLRWNGGKVNGSGWNYAYSLVVPDGVSTSILIIKGVSMENMAAGGLKFARAAGGTTGVYDRVLIADNIIDLTPNGIEGYAGVGDVTVGTNHINVTNAPLAIFGGNSWKILPNTWAPTSQPLHLEGATNTEMLDQTYLPGAIDIYNPGAAATISKSDNGRPLPNITATNAILAQFTFAAYSGGTFELSFQGLMQGVGGFTYRLRKVVSYVPGAFTVTDDGADISQGAAVGSLVLTVDAAGSTGVLTISLRSTGGGAVTGSSSCQFKGGLIRYLRP